MRTTFLGHGFEANSLNAVGHYLIENLKSTAFHSFIGLSAFASEAGIFGLSKHIKFAKENFSNLTLIVGIDQDGTSEEALTEILALDINSYIFYQNETAIFHPKIYLFEGKNYTKLIIGSSNLTGRGLFTNVESSLLIEFDYDDKEGNVLLNELKSYYHSLFTFADPNLFRITKTTISYFKEKGIVPDEATRNKIHNRKTIKSSISDKTGLDNLIVPKRPTARIPELFLTRKRGGVPQSDLTIIENEDQLGNDPTIAFVSEGILVWESGPLTERDLSIPKGTNTNATGSMLLKKGRTTGIDQRHYFRDEVFNFLNWVSDIKPANRHIERATAFFRFIIEGVDYGVFPLTLAHNTKTDTKTYLQNNSMTSLSWGNAKSLIAKEQLISKVVKLYKNDMETNNQYTLVID